MSLNSFTCCTLYFLNFLYICHTVIKNIIDTRLEEREAELDNWSLNFIHYSVSKQIYHEREILK